MKNKIICITLSISLLSIAKVAQPTAITDLVSSNSSIEYALEENTLRLDYTNSRLPLPLPLTNQYWLADRTDTPNIDMYIIEEIINEKEVIAPRGLIKNYKNIQKRFALVKTTFPSSGGPVQAGKIVHESSMAYPTSHNGTKYAFRQKFFSERDKLVHKMADKNFYIAFRNFIIVFILTILFIFIYLFTRHE